MLGAIMSEENDSYRDYCDSCSGVYPDMEFEGLLVEHWPNGNLKYRGEFKRDRKRVGQHICFHENGLLQEVGYWDDGWIIGTLIWFREDGSKECEKYFGQDGGHSRSWVERQYGWSNNDIWKLTVWKHDEIVGEWIEPELRKIEDEIGLDKMVDDAVKQLYPDEE
jgi:hypothetical protein